MSTPTSEIDRIKLLQFMNEHFPMSQIAHFALNLGVDYEALAGDTKNTKTRELIAYIDRRGRIEHLINIIQKSTNVPFDFIRTSTEPTTDVEAASLNIEIASLRQQVIELQQESLTDKQIEIRINEILKTANRAVVQSEELKAKLLLPPSELTDVPLVPIHSLERLEEYRSDENIAFLLIGTFSGSVLGILSNWATNENFIITRFSIVLMIFMIVLTSACILWVRSIRQRADLLKEKMLPPKDTPTEQTNPPTPQKMQQQ